MDKIITWTDVANQAWQARKQRMYFEKIEKNLFEQLRILSDNQERSEGGFLFHSIIRKGTVDYTIIPQLKSVDLEQYRKADIICWKLEKE